MDGKACLAVLGPRLGALPFKRTITKALEGNIINGHAQYGPRATTPGTGAGMSSSQIQGYFIFSRAVSEQVCRVTNLISLIKMDAEESSSESYVPSMHASFLRMWRPCSFDRFRLFGTRSTISRIGVSGLVVRQVIRVGRCRVHAMDE